MAKQLQEYAKKNDLKIIGAGDYKTFYDEGFIDLTPYEWVDLFRNAEKVITGTFHGTVFSIKYNKSVLCYPTEKNRINKIRSLLSDMKIASRLLEVGCEDDFIPLLEQCEGQFVLMTSDFEKVARHNDQLHSPSKYSPKREQILELYQKEGYEAVDRYFHKNYKKDILKYTVSGMLPKGLKRNIKKMAGKIKNK